MTAKEIEIHAGHWGNTGSGANGLLNEVKENRRVAKRVYEILQKSKVPSTYYEDNASTNQRDNINTIVKHHNADRDGLIASIHFNASGVTSSKGIGTEVLYSTQQELADKIAKAISDASGLINRGAKKRTDLGVLAKTYEPSILIEVCFVNSSVDAAIYRRDFEKICYAIAEQLANAIGKSLTPSKVGKGEVKAATQTKGIFRIKTGTFPNARAFADAIDKIKADFGWMIYEAADTTSFNPSYRIYTGTFETKEAAEEAEAKIKAKYGWTTYLIDETK